MLSALLTFTVASTLIVLLPGPDTLVVLRSVVLAGRRAGFLTAAGILTGLTLWMTAAAFGITAVIRASHDGYLALRIAGAAYLLYIGFKALRNRALGAPVEDLKPRNPIVGRGFRAGLTTDLLNPKVGVFFVTFLPAFIPRGEPVAGVTFALGAVFIAETAVYFGAILVFVDRLTGWLRNARIQRRVNRATGLVLIGFGARLAAES